MREAPSPDANRRYGAFVTKLTVETTYGILVVERGRGTFRIRLGNDAKNRRPDLGVMRSDPGQAFMFIRGWQPTDVNIKDRISDSMFQQAPY